MAELEVFDGSLSIRKSAASFLVVLTRVAPGYFAIPRGVIGPRPRSGYRSPSHCPKSARLPNGAEIDVNKDPAQHDQC